MSTFPALEARTPSDLTLQGLYERHAERIFRYCRRRLRSHEEAEDAVQETFLSAMRALQRGCVPVCETAWLFKIAEHTCCSVYRSRGRRDASSLAGMERIERLPSRTEDDDSLFGLEEALAAIPERQRRAFVLRELRGLSYLEIAGHLGVSVASVETLIYRARRSLARALESGAGRLTASLNLGSLVAAAKSLFTGATALKVASTTAVVAVAAVATGDTAQQRREPVPASSPTPTKVMSVRNSAVWGAPRNEEPAAVPRHRSLPAPVNGRAVPAGRRAAPTQAPAANPAPGEAPPAGAGSEPGAGGSNPAAFLPPSPAAPAPPASPLPPPPPATPAPPPSPPAAPPPAPPQASPPPAQLPMVAPVTVPGLVDPIIETLPQLPPLPQLPQLPPLNGGVPDPGGLLPALPQRP